jgi:hypothetical protein
MFLIWVIVGGEAAVVLNAVQYFIEAVMVTHSRGEVYAALSEAVSRPIVQSL